MLFLERDGVIEEELRSVPQDIRQGTPREVLVEWLRYISEQEGNLAGQGVG